MSFNKIQDYLYEKEMQSIRIACSEVWKNFGGAFKESIIDKALTIALEKQKLKVDDQKRIDIYFEEKKVGTYIPDKIVNNVILIELKCKPRLLQEDKKQFWYYLKASPYKVGLLINFGPRKLEICRRIYDKARRKKA
jgi:GxxExxY protein